MNTLMEDLDKVRAEHCSDGFLTKLRTLIEKASEVSVNLQRLKNVQGTSSKRRRLTNVSSSSDDVRYIPTEVDTVDLVSDSDDTTIEIMSDSSTTKVLRSAPQSAELNVNEVRTKRCVVKLQRIRFIGASAELERNDIVPSISNAANQDDLERNENKKTSWQVSVTENANKISKPIVSHYTYGDYRKRYREVCCTQ